MTPELMTPLIARKYRLHRIGTLSVYVDPEAVQLADVTEIAVIPSNADSVGVRIDSDIVPRYFQS